MWPVIQWARCCLGVCVTRSQAPNRFFKFFFFVLFFRLASPPRLQAWPFSLFRNSRGESGGGGGGGGGLILFAHLTQVALTA